MINQTNHIIMYKKRFIKNEVNVGMVNNRYNDTIYLTGWVWPSSSVNNYKTATSGQIKTITNFNITNHTLYNSITKWKCILNNIKCQKYHCTYLLRSFVVNCKWSVPNWIALASNKASPKWQIMNPKTIGVIVCIY